MSVHREILYPKDIGPIFLFGGSDILPRLVEHLGHFPGGHEVIRVFTSPRQAVENVRGETLLHALRNCKIPPVVTEDINASLRADEIPANAIGFGLGEAWTFSKEIRDAFGDRLLDYMSVPLPRYRGGAHISWAIMRGERQWGGRLQLITDNTVQGETDDGWIVDSWDYDIPPFCRTPQDWFNCCGWEDIMAIRRFLTQISMGRPFSAQPINERGSLFLPRLKTAINGWIDWSYPVEQLERFICAYDEPYPGAQTMLGDRIVSLKGVSWDGLIHPLVPFQRGLITRIDSKEVCNGGIHIAGVNGVILARRVLCEGMNITDQVKVGWRFVAPVERLEMALATTPTYTAKA